MRVMTQKKPEKNDQNLEEKGGKKQGNFHVFPKKTL